MVSLSCYEIEKYIYISADEKVFFRMIIHIFSVLSTAFATKA